MPHNSRAGLIYSREFMELARSRLNPGGMVTLWNCSLRTELTFLSVFPHVVKFDPEIIVGSNEPMRFDLPDIAARAATDVAVQANIAKLGQPVQLNLIKYVASWQPGSPRATGGINTDLRPLDEYYYNNNFNFSAFVNRLLHGKTEPQIKNPHL